MQTTPLSIDTKHEDQRRHRSVNRREALTLQLNQVVNDFELDACVLTDDHGQLVASSHTSLDAFEKAYTALQSYEFPRSESLCVREFYADGKRYKLATVGQETVMNEVSLYRTILGVRRIHTNTN